MKLKHARIVVQSLPEVRQEWKAALRGEKKGVQGDNQILFLDLASLARVFSKTRLELLQVIIRYRPKSIYELAKIVKRDFKNVHADVRILRDVGLIELEGTKDPRGGLKPLAKFSGFNFELAA